MAEETHPGSTVETPEQLASRTEAEAKARAEADAKAETPPEMNQSHAVLVGDKVQLNGTLFNVSSGQYDWVCTGPDNKDVPLTNPTMPGPSFTAEQVGAYVTTLTTDDGVATITCNATDPDASMGTSEAQRRRQEEAQRTTGQSQPGQQGQTVEQRQALEAQRQSQPRPGETPEQHQERVRQEQERRG